jgi:hypothetical protein
MRQDTLLSPSSLALPPFSPVHLPVYLYAPPLSTSRNVEHIDATFAGTKHINICFYICWGGAAPTPTFHPTFSTLPSLPDQSRKQSSRDCRQQTDPPISTLRARPAPAQHTANSYCFIARTILNLLAPRYIFGELVGRDDERLNSERNGTTFSTYVPTFAPAQMWIHICSHICWRPHPHLGPIYGGVPVHISRYAYPPRAVLLLSC